LNLHVAVKIFSCTLLLIISIRLWCFALRQLVLWSKRTTGKRVIAFFHPNVDQFGGGEKVFWHLLDVVAGETKNDPNAIIIIFCAPSEKQRTFQDLFTRASV
jgi:hypothetical protein